MAIVRMNKISLLGLEADKEQIMEALMKMGVVEIVNMEHRVSEDEWSQLVSKDGNEAAVSHLESDVAKVKSAIESLSRYDTRKKGLFASKRTIDSHQYNEIICNQDRVWEVVEQIIS